MLAPLKNLTHEAFLSAGTQPALTNEHRPKVLMHIECLRGTGELTLASRVAAALTEQGADVVVTSGNTRQFFKDNPAIKVRALPAIRYDDKDAKAYLTDDGRLLSEAPDWAAARAQMLRKIVAEEKPDAMLVCYWPFAGGQADKGKPILDSELGPMLERLRASRPEMPIYGSIREVIYADSQPYRGDAAQAARFINRNFAKVFVHGDPSFIPLSDDFDYASAVTPGKLEYTGYVCSSHPEAARAEKNLIIISAGGGDYRPSSARLLDKAVRSLKYMDRGFLKGKQVQILVGKSFDDHEYEKLQALLEEVRPKLGDSNVTLRLNRTIPLEDYEKLLPHCALFVGQAGVGTMMDIMTYHYPALVVPIEEKDEKGGYHFQEQLIRARVMADMGMLDIARPQDVEETGGAKVLAGRIDALLERGPSVAARVPIRLDGAEHTAQAICEAIKVQRAMTGAAAGKPVDSRVPNR